MPKLFNFTTSRRGLLVYGGEASADFGIVLAEAPAFERPTRKQSVFTVPGRNGAIIQQENAWNDVSRVYKVWVADSADKDLTDTVDAVAAWLNSKTGYNRLEDNFEPDVYRLAYYSGGDSFTNDLTQYGEASLRFTCRPERFLKDADNELEVVNGSEIINETRFASRPLIHLEGSGLVSFSIEGVTITASIADYINIDCESMNAYREPAENMNANITGTFPTIGPGVANIGITGTVTRATIRPRYFTI